ncbi:MAG: sensor histidine kinase [Sphingomonadaceae bacterium]
MVVEPGIIAHGCVDRQGCLIAADPPLLALQLSAGGEEGGVLVIPQLASLSRMARSLGVVVSRGVVAADGASDLDLWVNARLDGDLVTLAISGWTERPLTKLTPAAAAQRARDFAALEADGAWAINTEFEITAMSAGLGQLLGAAASRASGQPLTHTMRLIEDESGDFPLLLAALNRTAFAGQLAELRDMPHVQLYLSGVPRFASTGDFEGYDGTYALIDRALASVRAAVPSAVKPPEFANRLDAALRAPLTKIIGNADDIGALRDGPLRHVYEGYANDISSAGRHLLGLVDDLIDVQAVEQPDFHIETESVDLADIARRAAGLLRVRAADRGVRIDAPQNDESVLALGDFRRVLQIMVNLLTNAVRYSPSGSSIWLRVEQEGDLAAVIVADQGKGIAPEDQPRIFEKFERVDPSEPGGSGLGLFISRRLARAMGGDISVDSAPGRGARFVLALPVG